MSIKAMEDFSEMVAATEALHADAIKAWTQGGMPAVLALGRRHGYEFTAEEVIAVRDRASESRSEAMVAFGQKLEQALHGRPTSDELSEEELDLVAGGTNPTGPSKDGAT